jgi:hypothetical protein
VPRADAWGTSPLLDIGGDVGALVVYLAGDTPSGELEACPAGRPEERFHTGVHAVASPAGSVPVAVFPAVRAGAYDLLGPDDGRLATVVVGGGQVSEVDLRSRRP